MDLYLDVIASWKIWFFFFSLYILMLFHAFMQNYADSSFVIGGSDTAIRCIMTTCPFSRRQKGVKKVPWIETQVKYLMKLLIWLFWTCIFPNAILPHGPTSEKSVLVHGQTDGHGHSCRKLGPFPFRARTEVPVCPSVHLPVWGQGLGSAW